MLSFFDLFFLVTLDLSHSSFRNFFVGVCRIAESEGRSVDFRDLIPADYMLHRLSEELFALVFSALSTWKLLKDRMASEESSWLEVWSEDLQNGLSD